MLVSHYTGTAQSLVIVSRNGVKHLIVICLQNLDNTPVAALAEQIHFTVADILGRPLVVCSRFADFEMTAARNDISDGTCGRLLDTCKAATAAIGQIIGKNRFLPYASPIDDRTQNPIARFA